MHHNEAEHRTWRHNMDITYSQACENNKTAILSVLTKAFKHTEHVLEIGSGTGQHALFFSEKLPRLTWQPSDLLINHYSINYRRENSGVTNLLGPIIVDLNTTWGLSAQVDGIFTANTLHIVSWDLVKKFFASVAKNLISGGTLCIYGPFNYQGQYTSESNAEFDLWLHERDEASAIRDFENIEILANSSGLSLIEDNLMPANNRLLVFVMN
jgi:cyclopropane fatty-acyl-phospholipid synthase-like methyltransferase